MPARGASSTTAPSSSAAPLPPSPSSSSSGRLQRLRYNATHSDFVITVEDDDRQIHVHRAVLAEMSEVFERTISGGFREAKEGRLVIRDTSFEAVEKMVDWAYDVPLVLEGSSSSSSSSGSKQLVFGLWVLANRYQVGELEKHCSKVALAQLCHETAFELYSKSVLYGFGEGEERAFTFLVHNAADALQSPGALTVQELRKVLTSRELVAEEMHRFQMVVRWIGDDADRRRHAADLFQLIRFEMLNDADMEEVLDERHAALLPREVLVGVMRRTHTHAVVMPMYQAILHSGYEYGYSTDDNTSTVILPLPQSGASPKPMCFTCRHFVMSLSLKLDTGTFEAPQRKLELKLRCERRVAMAAGGGGKQELEDDLKCYQFVVQGVVGGQRGAEFKEVVSGIGGQRRFAKIVLHLEKLPTSSSSTPSSSSSSSRTNKESRCLIFACSAILMVTEEVTTVGDYVKMLDAYEREPCFIDD